MMLSSLRRPLGVAALILASALSLTACGETPPPDGEGPSQGEVSEEPEAPKAVQPGPVTVIDAGTLTPNLEKLMKAQDITSHRAADRVFREMAHPEYFHEVYEGFYNQGPASIWIQYLGAECQGPTHVTADLTPSGAVVITPTYKGEAVNCVRAVPAVGMVAVLPAPTR